MIGEAGTQPAGFARADAFDAHDRFGASVTNGRAFATTQVTPAVFGTGRTYRRARGAHVGCGVAVTFATLPASRAGSADLDQGPIIDQDVCRVSHRDDVEDLIQKGRELERQVLTRAVRLHLDRRVLVSDNRTIVFG